MIARVSMLLGVVLASGVASAQLSPPAGSLTLPPARGGQPAERATPAPVPTPVPRAPVQQVAPMTSPPLPQPPPRSALGSSAPGRTAQAPAPPRKPPVVAPKPHAGVQKPAAKPGVAAGVAAGAAAGVAAGVAAGAIAKPPEAKPPQTKPAETKPAPVEAKPPEPSKGSVTGQALPRWAGILYDGVKLRVGPGQRYPVDWIYRRPDQPVRVLREFETWRLIEDHEGVRGWVHQSNLTGRRSFMVPTERTLRRAAADDAAAVAVLRPSVVGRVRACAGQSAWCEVRVGEHRGWLKRDGLWGISSGEAIGN